MKWLVDDWREVLSHSFAFWLNAAGVFILIMDTVGYATGLLDLDPYWVGFTVLALLIGAMVLRLARQARRRGVERIKVIVVVVLACLLGLLMVPRAFGAPATQAETMAIAVPLVAKNEGLRLTAYKPFAWDRWTICYGETDGVHAGMTVTKAECDAMLRADLAARRRALHRFYLPETIQNRLPPHRDAAYLDVAYNCGTVAIGRSTATRRLNAGDIPGGCEALTWWNRGGGRVLIGLVRRRSADYRLCMVGA